jgi:hypothetical protein
VDHGRRRFSRPEYAFRSRFGSYAYLKPFCALPGTRIQDTANGAFQRLAGAGLQTVSTNPGDENEPAGREVKREQDAVVAQAVVAPEPP